ncbi:hypothetical protein MLC59_09035 [Marinobacter bryozoorum]|uniref:hypothetical protein n=1 Tax=Marinobacter bryozoorum TaxID=256324 RepID=UPI0020036365|nr:hypothetical protein [Marinobacter bryozoorum]MCK7544309.1 hypothetical protein [Marinobacter bryozoorum]
MTTTTGTTPHSNWQTIAPLLQALGCAPTDPANPATWQHQGEGHTLLVYGSPQQAIANAMDQDVAPSRAVQQWLESARAMADHFRRNRKKTLVIALDTLLQEPQRSIERISAAWGQQPPANLPAPAQPEAESEPLHQLLAAHIVATSPELTEAAQRLEACALPAEQPAPASGFNPDEYYGHIANAKQQPALEATVTRLESEKATLEGQLKALKANTQAQAKELSQQQQSHKNLEEENQLLLEQLHLVQEELESRHHQHQQELSNQQQKHQQDQSQLQQRIQQLLGEVENLRQNLAATNKAQKELQEQSEVANRDNTLALAAANRQVAELQAELKRISANKAWKASRRVTGYGRKSRQARQRVLEQNRKTIEESGLFDTEWYLETYPDVAESGMQPIEHYLKSGAIEGRNPGKVFDTLWYLMHYRDVAESGLNPLIHYIRFGRQEDRSPRPGAVVSLPAPQQPQPTQH